MENRDLIVNIYVAWLLVLISTGMTVLTFIANIQHSALAETYLFMTFAFSAATWIVLVSDMLQQKILHKPFWILSITFLPLFTMVLYLIQRNRLIRLGERFG